MGKYSDVYIAKTMQGLEEVLAKELKDLGACRIKPGRRMVEFSGGMNIVYKANYWLRTALRILVPIRSFRAIDEHQLYTETKAINWEKYLSLQHTFSVDSVVFSKYFNHSHYVALKVKDAIVDQFREKNGRRPSVNSKDPDIKINIYINIDRCTISLDSSGESLHKRGYRVDQHKTPLNEVLAAGLIMLSGWDKKTNFLDPMCGSGTFLIEAAMISRNIPPGYYRKKYSFMNWLDYDPELYKDIQVSPYSKQYKPKILGKDISFHAIATARENIRRADLMSSISLEVGSFETTGAPWISGFIIINPPYGERIKVAAIGKLYKTIGDHLKKEFPGYKAWIFSSNFEALKQIGLRPTVKRMLFNGPLECKFMGFEMYEGSK